MPERKKTSSRRRRLRPPVPKPEAAEADADQPASTSAELEAEARESSSPPADPVVSPRADTEAMLPASLDGAAPEPAAPPEPPKLVCVSNAQIGKLGRIKAKDKPTMSAAEAEGVITRLVKEGSGTPIPPEFVDKIAEYQKGYMVYLNTGHSFAVLTG